MTERADNAWVAVTEAPGVRAAAHEHVVALDQDWQLARCAPGAAADATQAAALGLDLRPAVVPGTVALADPEAARTLELDAYDHWYRCRFARPAAAADRVLLCLDGLATLADVYLNGELIARCENMFEAYAIDVSSTLQSQNELWIRFRALSEVLHVRRPRGRWPTRLVSEKNLRFVRTTLLGYMPGFCPNVRPVGPWRGVRLRAQSGLAVEHARVLATLVDGRGVLDVRLTCRTLADGNTPSRAELIAGGERAELRVEPLAAGQHVLHGRLVLAAVQPWWPHTHGTPHVYAASVQVQTAAGPVTLELGNVGFRTIELDTGNGDDFGLRVNGVPVFCRGACWMPLDVAALHAKEPQYRAALEQARDAGMNMLRVSGNTAYEHDAFYRLCDELGLLVWQELMFANLDYPVEDPAFMARCRREASQLLERLSGRACLAMLCGNSEVAQQAAMMGMGRETWESPLFDALLPELCAEQRPDVPYVASSPSGGALPFHTGRGPSHYYGVGAYLRPIDDARLRRVRFASECLAFSQPPDDASLRAFFGGDPVAVLDDPRYAAGIPRDTGADWSFADVTDHYLAALFAVEPKALRARDPYRYLALSRVATAEVMAAVQGLWRRRVSGCHGALIWMLRDLWQGAGLGVIDSSGAPKAAYYYLKRAWAKVALWIVDEGTDGLLLHACNDGDTRIAARIELALHRKDGGVVERLAREFELAPRSEQVLSVEGLVGHFVDASYAYRFGPPAHTLVCARLVCADEVLARAFHLPLGLSHEPSDDVKLSATARAEAGGSYRVSVSAERFAQSVHVDAPGFVPSDDYFHVAPGESHSLVLAPCGAMRELRGELRALNARSKVVLELEPDAEPAAARASRT